MSLPRVSQTQFLVSRERDRKLQLGEGGWRVDREAFPEEVASELTQEE